MDMHIV